MKVVPGADSPIVRKERVCAEIHGDSGLDTKSVASNQLFPSVEELNEYSEKNNILLSSEKAINKIASVLLREEPGSVTLLCTGALTNIALLFSVYPEVKAHIYEIVSMGGSMGIGTIFMINNFLKRKFNAYKTKETLVLWQNGTLNWIQKLQK